MAERKLMGSLVVLLAMIAVTCFAQQKQPVNNDAQKKVLLTNDLDTCLKITQGETVEANGMLMLKTTWQSEKSIGECGCKSALMTYSTNILSDDKINRKILETVISSLDKKEYDFILNADSTVKYNGSYEIVLSCKNPD